MACILILDRKEAPLKVMAKHLTALKHTVYTAANIVAAQKILNETTVDIILYSVDTEYARCLEFIEWALEHSGAFFVALGSMKLADTKTAYDLGVEAILKNPDSIDEVTKTVNALLKKLGPEDKAYEKLDILYCKVPIEEFSSKISNDYNVYIRLSERKYLKIGKKNESIAKERIQSYKDKGVQFFYIKKHDFTKLVNFNLTVMRYLKDSKTVSKENKLRFIETTNDVVMESAYVKGVDKVDFENAREFLSSTVSVLAENFEAIDLLQSLNAHSSALYAHSLGVSLYAILIARKMRFNSSQTYFQLGLAGLYHDIGKRDIPKELLEKNRPLLTAQERALVDSHPLLSFEILSKIPSIPSEVVRLVAEHHEDLRGKGYPKGLDRNQLHPLSKIIFIANAFVERVIKTRETKMPVMTAKAAFDDMQERFGDGMDRLTLEALKGIFSKG